MCEKNCVWILYYFNFERNYDVLKSKIPCILLNKNINFDKDETESKMGNLTRCFRETNFARFRSCKNFKLKVKLWWLGTRERKNEAFCTIYFVQRKFLTFEFYLNVQCIEYTFGIYIFLHMNKNYFIHFSACL